MLGSLIATAGRGFKPSQVVVLRLSLAASLLFFQEIVLFLFLLLDAQESELLLEAFLLISRNKEGMCGFLGSAVNKKAKYCISGTVNVLSKNRI